MVQTKTAKFIAKKRKEQGLTQFELAEKLEVSDRAISKWENGACMPEAAKMMKLCEILNITINELFSGEEIDMKDYNKNAEKNLVEAAKREEELSAKLLRSETIIGFTSSIIFLAGMFTISFFEFAWYYKLLIAIVTIVIFFVAMDYCMDIETNAGYYECKECGHKHIPTKKETYFAVHMGRTRKMHCDKCGKKTWQKKALSK